MAIESTFECREILLPAIFQLLDQHFRTATEKEANECLALTSDLLRIAEQEGQLTKQILPYLVNLIPNLLLKAAIFKENRNLYAMTLLTLFHLDNKFQLLWEALKKEPQELWNNLGKILLNFHSFILVPPFPEGWVEIVLFQHQSMYSAAQSIAQFIWKDLEEKATPNYFGDSDLSKKPDELQRKKEEVWKSLFRFSSLFVSSKTLGLIKGHESSIEPLKSKTITLMIATWENLGEHQTRFLTKDLIVPSIEFQLPTNPHDMRTSGANLFFSALQAEYKENKAIPKIESIAIEAMDKLSTKMALKQEFIDQFSDQITNKLKNADPEFQEAGNKFLKTIKTFLELLLQLNTLPKIRAYEDDRTVASVKLMDFLQQTHKKDTYVRFIHNLAEQHRGTQSYTEAAECLLLHASLYKWNDDIVGEVSGISTFFPKKHSGGG